MKKIYQYILIIVSNVLFAQIYVGNNWTLNMPQITEAGEDHANSYTISNQSTMDITMGGFFGGTDWYVNVKKVNIEWHSDLELRVRRSGTGFGIFGGFVESGESFSRIRNNERSFVRGSGWVFAIPLEYRITGMSVTLPAKTYSTQVVYTIYDD